MFTFLSPLRARNECTWPNCTRVEPSCHDALCRNGARTQQNTLFDLLTPLTKCSRISLNGAVDFVIILLRSSTYSFASTYIHIFSFIFSCRFKRLNTLEQVNANSCKITIRYRRDDFSAILAESSISSRIYFVLLIVIRSYVLWWVVPVPFQLGWPLSLHLAHSLYLPIPLYPTLFNCLPQLFCVRAAGTQTVMLLIFILLLILLASLATRFQSVVATTTRFNIGFALLFFIKQLAMVCRMISAR